MMPFRNYPQNQRLGKENTNHLLREKDQTSDEFVAQYSFAGFSNGTGRAPEGQPTFWETQTYRGPLKISMSDSLGERQGVEPRGGTMVMLRSGKDAQVFRFRNEKEHRLKVRLVVDHFTLHDIDGDTKVTLNATTPMPKEAWLAELTVHDAEYVKVLHPTSHDTSAKLVNYYDELLLTDEQRTEFGFAFNVVTALQSAASHNFSEHAVA